VAHVPEPAVSSGYVGKARDVVHRRNPYPGVDRPHGWATGGLHWWSDPW